MKKESFTPTTHGDWHIIGGKLVDLSKPQPQAPVDPVDVSTERAEAPPEVPATLANDKPASHDDIPQAISANPLRKLFGKD